MVSFQVVIREFIIARKPLLKRRMDFSIGTGEMTNLYVFDSVTTEGGGKKENN
jgi:hypothetical protein